MFLASCFSPNDASVLNLPVGHFVLIKTTPPRLENLIYFSALFLSLFKQSPLSYLAGSGSIAASPSCRQYVGIAFSASSDLRDFFHFVSSLRSRDLGELKSQCSIME